ncbi:MAG: chromosome segregation protein SMC [Lachnospiraceae bacterium]|nr:chromosome segregation protein SMC [Lachnospiraceae bacterium]
MYLKSIEVHGFKAFANKIVFDFHNGITGIVGPNGSGKSNVADAVRWVLGEQSAKQLRGASMQDVIFAGTENRKPLSYAYVAITLDNADHKLPIDFEEVTVARRVYRSGESEYLMNGSPCRLRDVHELFYDTGIGKEGYSIIGQGQIDRILSGKPEERRELFDEAAGIVKYKRRKITAQKKLEHERENLIRINDILAELERQLGPLERQSQKAHQYLKKKDELKNYDVNMFLLEIERMEHQFEEAEKNFGIASGHLVEVKEQHEKMRQEYETLESAMEQMDKQIDHIKDSIAGTDVMKGKLEGQINVLKEQIHTAEMTEEHLMERIKSVESQKVERKEQKAVYEKQKVEYETQLTAVEKAREKAEEKLREIQREIRRCKEGIESGKNEIIELLNQKASIKARQQRYDTMLEQMNLRKSQLSQRLLQRKTEEDDLEKALKKSEEELQIVLKQIEGNEEKEQEMLLKKEEWHKKTQINAQELEQANIQYNRTQSKMESLQNMAERYEGYGNSIRRIMEKRRRNPKIHGVVADLIQVEEKYEIAIETALSGSIQNIVTEDEKTAKEMIQYLKENRYGRATFLPITSVGKREMRRNEEVGRETGVIGYANELVQYDQKYRGIMAHLLGRVLLIDTIDHAISIAGKYHHTLSMVTLEGEYLRPGGSMSGGAFKNSSNLLGRKRELEELEQKKNALRQEIERLRVKDLEICTARDLLHEEIENIKEELQKAYILKNTAELHVRHAKEQREESTSVFLGLQAESDQVEKQILEITQKKEAIQEEILKAQMRETEIEQAGRELQEILDEQIYVEESAAKNVSEIQLEEANVGQKAEFVLENLERIQSEIERLEEELEGIREEAKSSKEEAKNRHQEIEEIEKTLFASDDTYASLVKELKESQEAKEQMSLEYKGFFEKREKVSREINELDKEIFRLNQQKERLEEGMESQQNYMWEEYELTYNHAKSLRNEAYDNLAKMKKAVEQIKEEIRGLGAVNVNAIEEYKAISERYDFLKGQRDDLMEAEQTLLGIIDDLDAGMKKQFTEKFAEIQKEFDKAFKELFGGGKGTLELVEEEEILESGIRIIAQPPGKKLQNMMQLSGGEKSLTAIALLFAIQNLKPSPFCLLDEIEAALDDNNVARFAKYLSKLTKNTQFIIITHRRGTMAAADRLYGITMQEKGVSTLVSVNLIEKDLD